MNLEDKNNIDISTVTILKEKIKFGSVASLSDIEIVALILSKGDVKNISEIKKAEHLLSENKTLSGLLSKISSSDKKTLGLSNSILLETVAEIVRRVVPEDKKSVFHIVSNVDVDALMRPCIGLLDYEEFWVISLNAANRVIDKRKISSGGVDKSIVDIKLLMRHVIQNLATSIIIVHNHPSGDCQPSRDDIELTEKIKTASRFVDIQLLDHVIIGRDSSLSMREINLF